MNKSKDSSYRGPNESPLLKGLSGGTFRAKSKRSVTLTFLFMIVLQIGCSKNNFEMGSSSDFSSTATPLAGTNHSMQSRTVNFPFYVQSVNIPLQSEQTELFITPQADLRTCQVQSFNKPASGDQLCLDVPDLCWSNIATTLDRDKDFTCAQAFQAQAIASTKVNNSCVPRTDYLSTKELQQINDPQIYTITSGLSLLNPESSQLLDLSPIQSFFENQQAQALPLLQSITLDASCRCSYSSEIGQTDQFPNSNNITSSLAPLSFKYPALPEHCHAHFSDTY